MHKLKITVIEDEPIVMAGLCSIISSESSEWEVVGTADNGRQGLKIIHESKPDIILTDIRMPYLDGLELIKRVRQQDEKVIIVILTGHADFNYAQLAVKYGVFDYILKPSSPKEIISVITRAKSEIDKMSVIKADKMIAENRESIASRLRDSALDPTFLGLIRSRNLNELLDRFVDEAEKSGFWNLEIHKAIRISHKVFDGLINRTADDRMVSLANMLGLKRDMVQIYKIDSKTGLQRFLKNILRKLTGCVSPDTNNNILVKKTLDYVSQDISRDFSLKDIADKMFLNYSYFSQLFKKETSMNFSDYLIYLRMEKAREMLNEVRAKTYKIAGNVGYSNAKHFSHTFKKIYGLSPSEYRNLFSN